MKSKQIEVPNLLAHNQFFKNICVFLLGLCVLCLPYSAKTQDYSTGLVGHWPWDGNVNDQSANANHATAFGGVTYGTGCNGAPNTALILDGSSGYLSMPQIAPYQLGTGNFSLSLWFKTTVSGIAVLWYPDAYPDPCIGVLLIGGGSIEARSSPAQVNTTDPLYSDDTWHHLAYTRNGTSQKVYVDGSLVVENTYAPLDNINTGIPIKIGFNNPSFSYWFPGSLDNYRLYNRVLSSADIAALYVHEITPPPMSYTWDGSIGNWTDASRWIPNGVPGTIDHATINSGQVNLTEATSIHNLTLTGGLLQGDFNLTIGGTLNWSGGTFGGLGTTTVAGAATLGNATLDKRTLQLNGGGTVTSNTPINTNNNANLIVPAGQTLTIDCSANTSWGGNGGTLTNQGMIVKTGGSFVAFNAQRFENTGTVQLNAGQWYMGGNGLNGNHTGAIFQLGANTLFSPNGGTHTFTGCAFSGTGDFGSNGNANIGTFMGNTFANTLGFAVYQNSTFNLGQNITAARYMQDGGTLNGTADVAVLGNATLTGGNVNNAGLWTVNGTFSASNATFGGNGASNIAGAATLGNFTLSARTLTLHGGGTVTDNAFVNTNNNANLVIPTGQTLTLNYTANTNWGGSGGTIANQGTIVKNGGAVLAFNGQTIENTGTFQLNAGQCYLGGNGFNGTHLGAAFQLAAGTLLSPIGDTHAFTGCTFSGNGNFGSNGTATINPFAGNTFANTLGLAVYQNSTFNLGQNVTTARYLQDGGILNGTGALLVEDVFFTGGQLAGTALKTITGDVSGTINANAATPLKFAPNGADIGTTAINGDFPNTASDLAIQLAGTNSDKITVTGNVALDADNSITVVVGSPAPVGAFVVLECSGNLSGTFAGTNSLTGYILLYDYTPGAGKVTLTPATCALNLSATPTPATCQQANDGAVALGVSGGTGPYTYTWAGPNGFTAATQNIGALLPGTYTVTVKDAPETCTATQTITVGVVNNIAAAITTNHPTCDNVADGALSAVVSGCGGCTFDYGWRKNGQLIGTLSNVGGLSIGNYSFEASTLINGFVCAISDNNLALLPEYNLNAAANVTAHVGCDALPVGAVALTVGSTPSGNLFPPFTFDIGNGYATEDEPSAAAHTFSALEAGNYPNVVITDANGCQGSTAFAVAGPATALTLSHAQTLVCHNTAGNLDLSVSGGIAPFQFQWSTGAATEDLTGVLAGNYTVSVTYGYTAGGNPVQCTATETIPVLSAGAEPQFAYTYPNNHLVSPLEADPYTTYRFEITYTDADNDPPAFGFPRLYIDKDNDGTFERSLGMNAVDAADLNYADGKAYFVEPVGLLPSPNYRTKIVLRDADGCETSTPTLDEPNILYLPDVNIFANDVSFVPTNPEPGQPMNVYANVHNPSDFEMTVVVRLESEYTSGDAAYNAQFPADQTVTIPAGSVRLVQWSMVTPPEVAFVPLYVTVDATDLFAEPNELDNSAVRPFLNGEYNLPVSIALDVVVTPVIASENCFFSTVYQLRGSNIRYTGLPPGVNPTVAGAQVTFAWQGQTFTGSTDDNGTFVFDLGTCDGLPVGNYQVTGLEITDFTVTSAPVATTFEVMAGDCGVYANCGNGGNGGGNGGTPDYKSGIGFPGYAIVGQAVSGGFSVVNIGTADATIPTSTQLVIFGNNAPAGVSAPTDPLTVGQTQNFSSSLVFNTPGTYGLQVVADAGAELAESNEVNNFSAIHFLQVIPASADLKPSTTLPINTVPLQCRVSNLTFTANNVGHAAAGAFVMRLEIFDENDVLEATYDQTVSGLTGLLGSTNASTKIFQHQFQHNAQYRLRITVDGGNAIAEYSEDNNSQEFLVNVGACEGDLLVTSTCNNFSVTPASPAYPGNITVNTRIKNTGPTAVFGPFKVKFFVNGNLAGTYTYSGTLNANAELPIAKQIPMPDPTVANTLEIAVDADNNVPEPLENNNTWATTLYSDLILNLSCNQDPNPPPPAPRNILYMGRFWENPVPVLSPQNLWVRFKNEGNIRRANVKVRYEMAGPGISGWQLLGHGITPLGVKPCELCNDDSSIPQNTNYLPDPVEFPQAGTYQVRMTIDPDNVCPETDESLASNQLVVNVTVVNIPDMRTLSQYIAPSLLNPDEGQQVNINVTFENLGQNNTQDQFDVTLLLDDVPIGTVRTNGVLQGDHRTVAMPPWTATGVGGHVLRAVIDSGDEVAEANENNNEATRIIFVGQSPNLRFLSFAVDNSSPVVNQIVTFSAVIKNEGDLAANAVLKLYYKNDDGENIEFPTSYNITVGPNSVLTPTLQIPWEVLDAMTLITAEISNSVPDEYYTGDNTATLTLNGLTFDLLVNSPNCGATTGSATVSNIAGGSGNYSVLWYANDSEIPLGSGPTIANLLPNTASDFYRVNVRDNDNADKSVVRVFYVQGIADTESPQANCPAPIAMTVDASTCDRTVAFSISATDNCTVSSVVATPPSGSVFPLGTTTVVVTAIDQSGNTGTCGFTVTLTDATAPTITCPANQTVAADANCAGTVGTYAPSSASDNCGSPSVSQSPAAATALNGHNSAQTVTLTATDVAGNTATCSFAVTLKDVTAPTITCPLNQTVAADANCAGTVGTYAPSSASDNCGSPSVSQSPAAATALNGHNSAQTVTLTATDVAGNTATCSFAVTLKDVTAPTIACPPNQTVAADANCAGTVGTYAPSSASDNCGSPSLSQSPAAATALNGHNSAQTVTLTATDVAGNTATCSFTVTLKDVTAPTITCPPNQTVAADANCAGTVGTYAPPSASDNCGSPSVSQSPAAATALNGHNSAQTVILTATDVAGNTATCSFTVTLKDVTAPTIACPANQTVAADANCAGTVGTHAPSSASDNCGSPSVSQSPVAATALNGHNSAQTVTLTATDVAGNTATCSFAVTLKDVTAPTIACPPNQTVAADANCAGTVGTYAPSSASDNCGSPSLSQSPAAATALNGHNSAQTVTLTATDVAGNTATCSFAVTLKDVTPPTISCPPTPAPVVCVGTPCAAPVQNIGVANLGDACGGTPLLVYALTGATNANGNGQASGLVFQEGITTLLYTATDLAGNTATCQITVTVINNQAPVLVCPPPQTISTVLCSVPVSYPLPNCIANCMGATITQTAGLPSGGLYPLGTTVNVFRATAMNGQTNACSFAITVADALPPSIACPTNIERPTDAGSCAAQVSYATPTATDNCSTPVVQYVSGGMSSTTFPVGTATVRWRATDAAGRTADCTFLVQVVDNIPPNLTCPANHMQPTAPGTCNALSYYMPTASDNCGATPTFSHKFSGATTVAVWTSGTGSGSYINKGITTVTLQATDGAGLTKTCTFRIIVSDLTPPSLTCPPPITANTSNATCSATVAYVAPSYTDNCSPVPQVAVRISGPTSGSAFQLGSTPVIFRATDLSGNSSLCTLWVTVEDNQPPAITCPASISVAGGGTPCRAAAFYPPPTASDNCAGTLTPFLLSGLASGSQFPAGVTTNLWRAITPSGQIAECSFTVTVQCPTNRPAGQPSSGQAATAIEQALSFSLAPNPAHDAVAVDIQFGGQTGGRSFYLAVWDAQGRKVWAQPLASDQRQVTLQVKDWAAGLYMVGFSDGVATVAKRLVVQNF